MDPSTRKDAYKILSFETGRKIPCLRVIINRAGVKDIVGSASLALPPDHEDALVVVCLAHARQGTPMTIQDFLTLASKVVKKKDDELFREHLSLFF